MTPARAAVGFVDRLRQAGLVVPTGATLAFTEAMSALRARRPEQIYWAGRATLVVHPEDIPLYDRVFHATWVDRQPPAPAIEVSQTLAVDGGETTTDDDSAADDSPPEQVLRFSAVESLREKDFAHYTGDELVLAQQMMSRLRLAGPPRRSNRLRPSADRHSLDLRATMRDSLRAGGEPVRLRWRGRGQRLRRLVLLLDVSGSMETYSRALVRFVHAAVAGRQKVEAFTFGTRLTRVTRELSTRDPDRALAQAAARVVDWSGGTRLGECIQSFNDRWGVRGMARGAIVVILSDGWDRGDPALLGEQMARLQRVAYRVVWVNPLKVTPGYAPLARGMAAALEHVDAFVEGHSVAAMERLIAAIRAQDHHDPRPDVATSRGGRSVVKEQA